MFGRWYVHSSPDSTAVLDRQSNAFSSCAIMLLLQAAAAVAGASQRRYIGAVGEDRRHLSTFLNLPRAISPARP